MALKLSEKVGPAFSSFNPYPSLPSVGIGNRVSMVPVFKTGPLFLGFN